MSVIKVDGVKFPNNQKLIKVFCWENYLKAWILDFKKYTEMIALMQSKIPLNTFIHTSIYILKACLLRLLVHNKFKTEKQNLSGQVFSSETQLVDSFCPIIVLESISSLYNTSEFKFLLGGAKLIKLQYFYSIIT